MSNVEELNTKYYARGVVFGKTWDGIDGYYTSKKYVEENNRNDLIKRIKEDYKSGKLDSGFGFERLNGAFIVITVVRQIKYCGKIYENRTNEDLLIGNITKADAKQAELYL